MRTAITLAVAASVAAACGEGPPDTQATDGHEAAPVGVHGVAPPPVGGVPSIVMLIPADAESSAPNDRSTSGGSSTVDPTSERVMEAAPLGPGLAGAASGTDELVVMDQLGMQFSPRALIVPAGGTVRFTNSESVAHNVRLQRLADGTVLLDSDTDPSGHVDVGFDQPGGYDVTCKTHPGMTAFVFASPTPFTVVADRDGAFDVAGVPPGRYTLRVWSADESLRQETAVTVSDTPQAVLLNAVIGG